MLALLALVLVGCQTDSWFDPSVMGRWERTPVTLPILDRLDAIDEPEPTHVEITSVQPEDLVPDVREYVLGPGDLVTVTVFELLRPGEDAVQTRRIDELGRFRLPEVGAVRAAGRSPSELEEDIAATLEREGIIRNATVSVIVQEARQNTFSVLGEPAHGTTAIGTYAIPKPEFRLLDALSMARGVPGRTQRLLILRQTTLYDDALDIEPPDDLDNGEPAPDPQEDPSELIDDLLRDADPDAPEANDEAVDEDTPPPARDDSPLPPGMERGLDEHGAPWVHVGGQWVRADTARAAAAAHAAAEQDRLEQLRGMMTQRVIEIPYQQLIDGDMSYNIIVRPGDIIRVPAPSAGFVYIMGEINRPGAYVVPGEHELTLMRLIASGGNLGALAIPERVDITRQVGRNQQTTIRLDLRAMFQGQEPDIFLKRNDLVNIGTTWWAQPLAVIRNGFRATYGFGFILDRNFGPDVFD